MPNPEIQKQRDALLKAQASSAEMGDVGKLFSASTLKLIRRSAICFADDEAQHQLSGAA